MRTREFGYRAPSTKYRASSMEYEAPSEGREYYQDRDVHATRSRHAVMSDPEDDLLLHAVEEEEQGTENGSSY